MDKKEKVVIYDVFAYFPGATIEEVLVATTKNKLKAKVLVEALKDCGTEAFIAGRVVYTDDKLFQELKD